MAWLRWLPLMRNNVPFQDVLTIYIYLFSSLCYFGTIYPRSSLMFFSDIQCHSRIFNCVTNTRKQSVSPLIINIYSQIYAFTCFQIINQLISNLSICETIFFEQILTETVLVYKSATRLWFFYMSVWITLYTWKKLIDCLN